MSYYLVCVSKKTFRVHRCWVPSLKPDCWLGSITNSIVWPSSIQMPKISRCAWRISITFWHCCRWQQQRRFRCLFGRNRWLWLCTDCKIEWIFTLSNTNRCGNRGTSLNFSCKKKKKNLKRTWWWPRKKVCRWGITWPTVPSAKLLVTDCADSKKKNLPVTWWTTRCRKKAAPAAFVRTNVRGTCTPVNRSSGFVSKSRSRVLSAPSKKSTKQNTELCLR